MNKVAKLFTELWEAQARDEHSLIAYFRRLLDDHRPDELNEGLVIALNSKSPFRPRMKCKNGHMKGYYGSCATCKRLKNQRHYQRRKMKAFDVPPASA